MVVLVAHAGHAPPLTTPSSGHAPPPTTPSAGHAPPLASPLSDHTLLCPRPSGHTFPTVVHEMLSLSVCSRSKVQNYDLRWEFGS